MTIAWTAANSSLLLLLLNAAARALALAAVAGTALSILRVKNISTRLFTWTAVLYAALAIPALGWLLPPLSLPLPALLQGVSIPVRAAPVDVQSATVPLQERIIQPRLQPRMETSPVVPASPSSVDSHPGALSSRTSWKNIGTVIYIVVSLMLLARVGIGLILTNRLVRAAQPVANERLRSAIVQRGNPGNIPLPDVRESSKTSVPVTMGLSRPKILLPTNWREWDEEKLFAVLSHETSHVRRRDPLVQCLALMHRAIFWFSPFAWWLNRHLANLAEQASDEAALNGGADRNLYARTLLAFFEALHVAPHRVWWQGVSMASQGPAEQRLEKILSWKGPVSMNLKNSAICAIVACAIPVLYIAASVSPVSASSRPISGQEPAPAASTAPAPPPTPATPPAHRIAAAPIAGVPIRGVIAGVPAPAPPVAAVAGIPVLPPTPAQSIRGNHHHAGNWYSYGMDEEQRFVIVTGKSDSLTMSGSSEDARHAEKLRKQIPGDFIWFQRDEKSYIIRDQPTIDRARKLWAPQEELGKKQEELGRQQEALGKQQEELGAKMEKVQVKVPDMTAQLDKLRAELKSLNSGATQEQIGKLQSEIGELQSQLGEVQSHAGEQQSKIGEEMGALGEKQGKLGAQQGELGRQQAELAEKATKEMKQLLDDAIKNGTAKPEPGESDGVSL